MPVAPVAFEITDRRGHLLDLRLDLLQTDDVGLRLADPLQKLLVSRANPVDVPGGDFHRRRSLSCPRNAPHSSSCADEKSSRSPKSRASILQESAATLEAFT